MLRKNTAGQFLHVAAVNATTGAALTGATLSGRRCIDGTFAAIGATITEDTGTGFYKVALTQADTDGNDIGYFFTATNMIPVQITVVTTACDPTSTAFGLSLAKTTNITGFNDIAATAVVSAGAITTSGGAVSTVSAVTGLTAANLDVAVSTRLATAGYTAPLDAAGTRTAVGLASANLDTQLTAIDDFLDTEVAAIKAKTDLIPASPASTTNITAASGISLATGGVGTGDIDATALNEIADAILDRVMSAGADSGADTTSGRTVRQALRALRNRVGISAGTMTVYKENDTTASWTSALTRTAGDPISESNPT